jgi:RNA polymerase sigma-70 factor (ECF subfamily)
LTDRTNEEWLDALRDPISDEALTDLRNTLVRGLRAALSNRIDTDLDTISEDFAQDALLKILDSLETFRGESRFTTWAQKIAIHVAFTELRRRRWKDISLQQFTETDEGDEYTPPILTDPGVTPEEKTTQHSVLDIVQEMIEEELTERQQMAMLAIVQKGMPIEEVARRMDTNRNALYKLMYDARQRLRERLEEKTGMSAHDVLVLFGER